MATRLWACAAILVAVSSSAKSAPVDHVPLDQCELFGLIRQTQSRVRSLDVKYNYNYAATDRVLGERIISVGTKKGQN